MPCHHFGFLEHFGELLQNFLQVPSLLLCHFSGNPVNSGRIEGNIIALWLYDIVLILYQFAVFIMQLPSNLHHPRPVVRI